MNSNSEEPLVSIITPTYNHENYIACCIESVLAQSYRNWEMIIVNDGSSDRTREIAESYAARDSRIKIYSQENRGVLRLKETYNLALEKSLGRLIAILEGDDFWPPQKLEMQVRLHIDIPFLTLSHGIAKIIKEGKPNGDYCYPPTKGLDSSNKYLRYILYRESCLMPVTVIIDKLALQSIGGFHQDPGFPAIDYSTFIRLFEVPGMVFWHSEILGYWRQSSNQVTKNYGLELAEAALKIAIERLSSSRSAPPDITSQRIKQRHYDKVILPVYLQLLRKSLADKQQGKARKYALTLIRHGSMKRKAQGLMGHLVSYTGTDIEWFFKAYERILGGKS